MTGSKEVINARGQSCKYSMIIIYDNILEANFSQSYKETMIEERFSFISFLLVQFDPYLLLLPFADISYVGHTTVH